MSLPFTCVLFKRIVAKMVLLLFAILGILSFSGQRISACNYFTPQDTIAAPRNIITDSLPASNRVERNNTPDPPEPIRNGESEMTLTADTIVEQENGKKKRDFSDHSPLRATMLSATLPGLGQIYNRKIWKVPIIYAGFVTIGYFVQFNNNEYQSFRQAYIARVDGNPNTVDNFPLYSTDNLERAYNFYRRNLEVTYIVGAALYVLNILDATVDAHLLDFDVDEDLTLNILPGIIPNNNGSVLGSSPGLKLSVSF